MQSDLHRLTRKRRMKKRRKNTPPSDVGPGRHVMLPTPKSPPPLMMDGNCRNAKAHTEGARFVHMLKDLGVLAVIHKFAHLPAST